MHDDKLAESNETMGDLAKDGRYGTATGILLFATVAVSSVLLVRFSISFFAEGPLLAVPLMMLATVTLLLAAAEAFAAFRRDGIRAKTRDIKSVVMLGLIPLAFLGSSLGCSGLAARGCTPFCTFIKLLWIPAIAIAVTVYYFAGKSWLLFVVGLMAWVPMVPNCACYNVVNGWWIDRIGKSPECYVWAFVVSAILIGALRSGRYVAPALLISITVVGGSLTFFVSHHYFHYPW
ncbi:MAG TPA: hypothetical protein VI756_18530 [Blastocatellia bacterium]